MTLFHILHRKILIGVKKIGTEKVPAPPDTDIFGVTLLSLKAAE